MRSTRDRGPSAGELRREDEATHRPQDQTLTSMAMLPRGTYRLHPESTTVHFSDRKFGLFTIRGTMRLAEGSITIADPITRSSVRAVLTADTFTTPMAKRDDHVRSEKLLDVARFPTIEFRGERAAESPSGWTVLGTLTVHGQQQDCTLAIDEITERDGTVHVTARARVDRNDFGVTGMKVAAGPYVDIRIHAMASRA